MATGDGQRRRAWNKGKRFGGGEEAAYKMIVRRSGAGMPTRVVCSKNNTKQELILAVADGVG